MTAALILEALPRDAGAPSGASRAFFVFAEIAAKAHVLAQIIRSDLWAEFDPPGPLLSPARRNH